MLLHDIVVLFKSFECLFFGIVLFIIVASTFDVQSIEKRNENSFHTWKMNIEFLLHEKSFEQSYCYERLSLEKLFLKDIFMNIACSWKKNKLTCWTIFLQYSCCFSLHHVACVKSIEKKAWDNNLCATFEKWHVDNK